MNPQFDVDSNQNQSKMLGIERFSTMRILESLILKAEAQVACNPLEALKSLDRAQSMLLPGSTVQVARSGGLAPWQSRKIVQFIEQNLASSIRISELARIAKLCESHLSRAFKTTFGVSPYSYIIGRRLDVAKELMITTDEPLSQIALDCGMSDQSHFCNLFRQSFNTTPNAWRRQHRLGGGEIA